MALSRADREALKRAMDIARAGDPLRREQIDSMLRERSRQEVAEFASFHCQVDALRLRPWQCPPSDASDAVSPDTYGGRPEEVALLKRMLALGISRYEPDPLTAIAAAEAKATAASG